MFHIPFIKGHTKAIFPSSKEEKAPEKIAAARETRARTNESGRWVGRAAMWMNALKYLSKSPDIFGRSEEEEEGFTWF